MGFPGGSVGIESNHNGGEAGDTGLIPESGRSPGGGHGNPLQYSCLKNPMDRGPWRATVHKFAELDRTEYAHTHTYTHIYSINSKTLDRKVLHITLYVFISISCISIYYSPHIHREYMFSELIED